MKIWASLRKDGRIVAESIQDFPHASRQSADWADILGALCKPLDVARPLILQKHEEELRRFSRAVFKADDFLESICFDRLEVEIFPEEKRR